MSFNFKTLNQLGNIRFPMNFLILSEFETLEYTVVDFINNF